jgi:prolipoprotein diacylglyceryltransferase
MFSTPTTITTATITKRKKIQSSITTIILIIIIIIIFGGRLGMEKLDIGSKREMGEKICFKIKALRVKDCPF